MRNLITLLFLSITMQTMAQSFEGTIVWTAKPAGASGPINLNMKVKGGTLITVMQGGMMNGVEMWFSDHNNKVVRIMRNQKMFMVVPAEALKAADNAVQFGAFTKTTETATIAGYACTKYTGDVKEQGKTTKVSYWTTTALKDDTNVLARQPSPFSSPKLPAEVKGIPLKIEKAGGEALEVTEIKSATLSDADFTIPADFAEMGK